MPYSGHYYVNECYQDSDCPLLYGPPEDTSCCTYDDAANGEGVGTNIYYKFCCYPEPREKLSFWEDIG